MATYEDLTRMLDEGYSADEIRAELEGLLPPGCRLEAWTESCVTDDGTSGSRVCARVSGCDDPSNNSEDSCGNCLVG